jgi:hypothetical protein
MFILNQKASKKSESKRFFVCTTNWKRGSERCANNLRVPYEHLTDAVISAFETKLLDPATVEKFWRDEQAASSAETVAAEKAQLQSDVKRLDSEIKKLIILADGDDDIEELKARLGEKRQARSAKVARIETLAARQSEDSPAVAFAEWLIAQDVQQQADGTYRITMGVDLGEMLRSDIPQARQILRGFLKGGQIVLTPETTDAGNLRIQSVNFAIAVTWATSWAGCTPASRR